MLKIRLQRYGKKKNPAYRISVIEHNKKREGKPTEVLGFYNPITKELVYNKERASYWQGVGAKPSETVAFLLSKEPTHDLANGPYKASATPRAEKIKNKEELLKQSTKNTKAKKKHAEAAAAKAAEEAEAKEAPAEEASPAS